MSRNTQNNTKNKCKNPPAMSPRSLSLSLYLFPLGRFLKGSQQENRHFLGGPLAKRAPLIPPGAVQARLVGVELARGAPRSGRAVRCVHEDVALLKLSSFHLLKPRERNENVSSSEIDSL